MSNLPLFTAGQKEDLIQDVIVRSLMVNEDPRGILVETLRTDWHDVYHEGRMPFAQCYYSITNPGVARDEDQWHVHQHQDDRFLCLSGQLVVAIFDSRPASLTAGRLNLFHIGPEAPGNGHLLVLIPRRTMHGLRNGKQSLRLRAMYYWRGGCSGSRKSVSPKGCLMCLSRELSRMSFSAPAIRTREETPRIKLTSLGPGRPS